MKIVNNRLKLTAKELSTLQEIYTRYKARREHEFLPTFEKVEAIMEKDRQDRIFTLLELETFMHWRRPKGTPYADKDYFRFLNAFFRLLKCPVCKGKGGWDDTGVCTTCHGSGHTEEFEQLEGYKEWRKLRFQ